MKKISEIGYLRILFVVILAVLTFISFLVFRHIHNLAKSSELLVHTYEVNIELEQISSYMKEAETNHRGYLLTTDSSYLKLYLQTRENVNNTFVNLRELTNDDQIQQQKLISLNVLINKKYANFSSLFRVNPNQVQTNLNLRAYRPLLLEGKKIMDQIRLEIKNMQMHESILLKKRNRELKKQRRVTPFVLSSLILFSLLLMIIAYVKFIVDYKYLKQKNDELLIFQESSNQAQLISGNGNWVWDTEEDKYTYSDNLYRLLGVEPQSFEPNIENFVKYVHPDDAASLLEDVAKMVEKQELPFIYYRIIRPDGATRYFKAFGKPFINFEGKKSIIGTTSDVTEDYIKELKIKENLKELQKVNAELKIFEESTKQAEIIGEYGSWILNLTTNSFTYSDNKFRLLGCEPQSFNPTIEKLLEFVHPEDKEIIQPLNISALTNSEVPVMNYRIIRPDGSTRYFKTIAKHYNDSNNVHCMIGTTADVTKEVRGIKDLEHRNEELMKNNTELAAFNYVASHDLQEPLRKIQTFISRLEGKESENFSESGNLYFERIKAAASRMRLLIDDLLLYSRTSKVEKNLELVDLDETLKTVSIDLEEVILEKNAQIISAKLPKIMAIPFQVHQLFVNLISNSIKYSKSDVSPKINISYTLVKSKECDDIKDKSVESYHRIIFEDNGIGFDQAYSEQIFNLFNRLHDRASYSGTGIGLAICRKIVNNHKGCIRAVSELGIGSKFIVLFPNI
jgi:signal transduction histidine kinase/CHASE3 domain sensor protein